MNHSDTIVGLGGRTDFVATVPNADPVRLKLTADESQVFATIGRYARIDEVITRSGLPEAKAIAVLLSLRAKGAIAPARVSRPNMPAVPADAAAAEVVELEPGRKEEILALERTLEGANHFETLGLAPGATAEESKAAYHDMARRFHPDRFYGKNLGSFRARLDKIFHRITEAQLGLTDPQKRAAYRAAHPALFPADAPPPPSLSEPLNQQREAERRARLSRHPYLARNSRLSEVIVRAKAHLERGDVSMAYTDLHLASQIEPTNREVQALLQEVRKKHEALRAGDEAKKANEAERMGDFATAATHYKLAAGIDQRNAMAAYKAASMMQKMGGDPKEIRTLVQRAAELEPKNAAFKLLLGVVLELGGSKKLAKKAFEEVLELDPDNQEAKKQLKKFRLLPF